MIDHAVDTRSHARILVSRESACPCRFLPQRKAFRREITVFRPGIARGLDDEIKRGQSNLRSSRALQGISFVGYGLVTP